MGDLTHGVSWGLWGKWEMGDLTHGVLTHGVHGVSTGTNTAAASY